MEDKQKVLEFEKVFAEKKVDAKEKVFAEKKVLECETEMASHVGKSGFVWMLSHNNEWFDFCSDALQELNYTLKDARFLLKNGDSKELAMDGSLCFLLVDFEYLIENTSDYLHRLVEGRRNLKIVVLSTMKNSIFAVKALQEGAKDFIDFPCSKASFIRRFQNIVSKWKSQSVNDKIAENNQYFPEELKSFLGNTDEIMKLKQDLILFANTDLPILIHGESGTGKTLVAEIVHKISSRKNKSFLPVNCSAIVPSLFESEVFGNVKGAFTGALEKKGYLEMAKGGTVFFDEIGELPFEMQPKILKAVEEMRFFKVGSATETSFDARLIFATNTDLKYAIKEKRFREDLYHRISVLELYVPPLRERITDVETLAKKFLQPFEKRLGSVAMEKLMDYDYPGNVRELKNIISRAVVLSSEDTIQPEAIRFSSLR